MELNKILVRVDFSEASEAGLEQAAELARYRGASLVLARVVDLPRPPVWEDDSHGDIEAQYDELSRIQRELEDAALEELNKRYRETGVATEQVLIEGKPARGLLAAAKDHEVDLIVLGERGRTGQDPGNLGSVAARVARRAECPVLVARPGGDGRGGFRRLLLATEFSGYADRLMRAAAAVSSTDADIDVLHTWRLPFGAYSRAMVHDSPVDLAQELRDKVTTHAKKRGAEMVQRYDSYGRTVRFLLEEAKARKGILAQLEKEPYDCVVVGTHGARGFRPLSLGSTAAAVVRRAHTTVLVVPIGKPREGDDD